MKEREYYMIVHIAGKLEYLTVDGEFSKDKKNAYLFRNHGDCFVTLGVLANAANAEKATYDIVKIMVNEDDIK